jgi:acyl carrier protein
VTAAAAVDWGRCLSYDGRGGRTARLRVVMGPHLDRQDGGRTAAVRAELAKATPEARVVALASLLSDLVAEALRIDPDALTPSRPLDEVGIDSLIAVDVQLAIDSALGVSVSTMQIIGKATLTSLAAAVLTQMGLGAVAEPAEAAAQPPLAAE